MIRFHSFATAAVLCLAALTAAQESEAEMEKLDFMVGRWRSQSVKLETGEEIVGFSSIQWVLKGKWLQWKFEAELERGSLEMLNQVRNGCIRSEIGLSVPDSLEISNHSPKLI